MDLDLQTTKLIKVSDIVIPEIFNRRMKTGVDTIDSFFGEGILPGCSFTITAPAGCGKTTFLLQLLEYLEKQGHNTAYFSGEESIYQLAFNCRRLNVQNVSIANETDVEKIAESMNHHDFIVIDSFPSLSTSKGKMNSRSFEKYAVTTLVKQAKKTECNIAFILHLTKDGKLKGNTLIPHTVDACISIVKEEDNLRNIHFTKNRFGPTNELVTYMGAFGYDFYTPVEKDDPKEEKQQDKKATKRISQNQELKQAIVQYIVDNTKATKQDLIGIPDMDNAGKLNRLLRELVDEGKLYKRGYGNNSFWKIEVVS
jgi:predicted ATP-dependent serine protease